MVAGDGLWRGNVLNWDMEVREGLGALGAQGHAIGDVLNESEAAGRPADWKARLAPKRSDAADAMASLTDRKEGRLLRGRATTTGNVDIMLRVFPQ